MRLLKTCSSSLVSESSNSASDSITCSGLSEIRLNKVMSKLSCFVGLKACCVEVKTGFAGVDVMPICGVEFVVSEGATIIAGGGAVGADMAGAGGGCIVVCATGGCGRPEALLETVDLLIIVAVLLTVALEVGTDVTCGFELTTFWGSFLDDVDLTIVAEEDLTGGGA